VNQTGASPAALPIEIAPGARRPLISGYIGRCGTDLRCDRFRRTAGPVPPGD